MKNVRLRYSGSTRKVKLAVDKANEVLNSDLFYRQICNLASSEQFNFSPDFIAQLLRDSDYSIEVKVNWLLPDIYQPRFDRIIVNGWDFSVHPASGVNTLICETIIAIDRVYDIVRKDRTEGIASRGAPLVIGAIAEVMVR